MSKVIKWIMFFVVLIILGSGSIAVYTVFFADKGLTMPQFKDMSILDAIAEAERLGLSVRILRIRG